MASIAEFQEALSAVVAHMLCSRNSLHSLTPLTKCWAKRSAVWGYNTRLKAMMKFNMSHSSSIKSSVNNMYPRFAAEIHMSVVVPARRLRQRSVRYCAVNVFCSLHMSMIRLRSVFRDGTSYSSRRDAQNSMKSFLSTKEKGCEWFTKDRVSRRSFSFFSAALNKLGALYFRFTPVAEIYGGLV
jgi:hypothetical protein